MTNAIRSFSFGANIPGTFKGNVKCESRDKTLEKLSVRHCFRIIEVTLTRAAAKFEIFSLKF